MEDQALAISAQETSFPMAFGEAQFQFENLKKFISSQLKEGEDFGRIPGAKKPSMWKPGAEKLRFFNRIGVRLDPTPELPLRLVSSRLPRT